MLKKPYANFTCGTTMGVIAYFRMLKQVITEVVREECPMNCKFYMAGNAQILGTHSDHSSHHSHF
jgi:hypothetical protein